MMTIYLYLLKRVKLFVMLFINISVKDFPSEQYFI